MRPSRRRATPMAESLAWLPTVAAVACYVSFSVGFAIKICENEAEDDPPYIVPMFLFWPVIIALALGTKLADKLSEWFKEDWRKKGHRDA